MKIPKHGRAVTELRLKKSLTLTDFAETMGEPLEVVLAWEEQASHLNFELLERMAKALGCTMGQLIDGESEPQTVSNELPGVPPFPNVAVKKQGRGLSVPAEADRQALVDWSAAWNKVHGRGGDVAVQKRCGVHSSTVGRWRLDAQADSRVADAIVRLAKESDQEEPDSDAAKELRNAIMHPIGGRGKTITEAEKRQIVAFAQDYDARNGSGGAMEAGKLTGLHYTTVARWRREANATGPKLLKKGEFQKPFEEQENEAATKPTRASQREGSGKRFTDKEKRSILKWLEQDTARNGYGAISRACKKFNTTAASISTWKKKFSKGKPKVVKADRPETPPSPAQIAAQKKRAANIRKKAS